MVCILNNPIPIIKCDMTTKTDDTDKNINTYSKYKYQKKYYYRHREEILNRRKMYRNLNYLLKITQQ